MMSSNKVEATDISTMREMDKEWQYEQYTRDLDKNGLPDDALIKFYEDRFPGLIKEMTSKHCFEEPREADDSDVYDFFEHYNRDMTAEEIEEMERSNQELDDEERENYLLYDPGSRQKILYPMPVELKKAIIWWLETRPIKNNVNLFYCLEDKPHVGIEYGKPYVERKDFMNRICAKAKVKPFGFHSIRHLRATTLFHQGKSIATIQRLLRHKNPNTTVKYLRSLGLDVMNDELKDLNLLNGETLMFQDEGIK